MIFKTNSIKSPTFPYQISHSYTAYPYTNPQNIHFKMHKISQIIQLTSKSLSKSHKGGVLSPHKKSPPLHIKPHTLNCKLHLTNHP